MSADRAALAARNKALAAQKHRPGVRARVRNALLAALARLPVSPARHARTDAILLLRPDHLGDVLFITPAVRALRAACPAAEITALVGPWSAGVLAPFPEINHLVTLRFPGFTRQRKGGLAAPYVLAWQSARKLRELAYGAAVILRPDHWWGGLLAYLAGIPLRVGYDLPGVSGFLTDRHAYATGVHSVQLNLKLVERWTGRLAGADVRLAYPLLKEDIAYVDAYLSERGSGRLPEGQRGATGGERLIAVHVGSGSVYKTWLADRWARVSDALAERHGARIVLTGAAREASAARAVASQMRTPAIIAAGDTTIGQLAALYARSDLVLGPDSGPLHLAVAVGTPTVHLYGPADPSVYGPWGPRERHAVVQSQWMGCVPCGVLDWSGDRPDNHPCVQEITVAQALAAADAVLAAGG